MKGDFPRWAELGLSDPVPTARLLSDAQIADILVFALVPPSAEDPVIGIVDGVALELHALGQVVDTEPMRDVLFMLARRLDVAMLLLRRVDAGMPIPREYDPDADTQTAEPKPSPEEPSDA